MFALVSIDGRYHGHTASAADAKKLDAVKKSTVPGYFRLLSEEEWGQVVADRSQRPALCAALGNAVS